MYWVIVGIVGVVLGIVGIVVSSMYSSSKNWQCNAVLLVGQAVH